MPIYVGNTEITNANQVQVGTSNVSAVFVGDELVFPTITNVTLSGFITDLAGDASVSPLNYSVTGSPGDVIQQVFTVTADAGYRYTSTNLPTVNSLDHGSAEVVLNGNNATVTVDFTIPSANTSDNFIISGQAETILPLWECTDYDGTVAVSSSGSITVTGGTGVQSMVVINTDDFGPNGGCSSISRTVSFTVTVNGDGVYHNHGEPVTCSETVNQPGSGADFTLNDWTGSLNVSSSGVVTVGSVGNVDSVTIITETCNNGSSDCSSATCSALVSLNGAPTGFCNAGGSITVTVTGLTRPAGRSGWTFNDWNGTVSVAVDGTISATQGNSGSTPVINTSNFSSNASGCSGISRTVNVSVTAPSGECNVGSTVSGNQSSTQPAGGTNFTCDDLNVNVEVSSGGTITVSPLNATLIAGSVSPTSYAGNSGCSSLSRRVDFAVTAPSGYCNTGSRVDCNETVSQPGGGSNFTQSDWTGFLNVDSSGNVTVGSTGNVTSVNIITEGCTDGSSSCNSQSCTATINLIGIPSGYCNTGGTITVNESLTRPAGRADWAFSDWTGDVTVDVDGSISVTRGNSALTPVINTSDFASNASGCTGISRTVSVTVRAPSGECNSFGSVTGNVSVTQPAGGSNFQCSDSNTIVEVSSSGVVSVSSTAATVSGINPTSVTANSGCSSVPRTISFNLTAPSGWCNTGSLIPCSETVNQPGSGVTFTQDDWTGSASTDSSGNVSVTNGNATSSTIIFETCGTADNCDSQTCSATISLGVPTGYCNSGGTITVNVSITQASAGGGDFGCSDAGISGFAVSSSGTITAPSVSSGTISGITYVGSSGGSYSTVTSATTRTANFNITVPSGECNAGAVIPCSATATQAAAVSCNTYFITYTASAGAPGVVRFTPCGSSFETVMQIFFSRSICSATLPVNQSGTSVGSAGSACT